MGCAGGRCDVEQTENRQWSLRIDDGHTHGSLAPRELPAPEVAVSSGSPPSSCPRAVLEHGI